MHMRSDEGFELRLINQLLPDTSFLSVSVEIAQANDRTCIPRADELRSDSISIIPLTASSLITSLKERLEARDNMAALWHALSAFLS